MFTNLFCGCSRLPGDRYVAGFYHVPVPVAD